MNYKLLIIGAVWIATLLACQSKNEETDLTLEDKKALLTEKQALKKSLEQEINRLQDEIVKLSPELQAKPTLIDTIHLNTETFIRNIDIQGSVEADERVSVVSEIPGRILSLTAKEGDYIKAGQLIATLDVEAIDKQIAEVNTSLSLAQDVFDRQSRLWNQNIGSEVQYLQAKNNVERLEKSLETLNHQLNKAKVYAPISGAVDVEVMKQGEYASPGMPIIQILNTSKIKIVTDLPERYLRIVKQGDWVDLNFPSIDMQMKGKVTQLGRTIDPANRTLEVKIAPSKYSSLLKPNLLAEIQVEEVNIPNVVKIPVEYILQEVDGKEFVYVVDFKNPKELRAEKRYIETGESALNEIIVTSGLSDQDIVVSKGARNLSNGELVTYMNK